MEASHRTFRFGHFEFDARSGELRRNGIAIRLQEQPYQILTLLLCRPGEVVTREEVRQALWPGDTFVDFDTGVNSAIKRLRDALHDSADKPRFVETVPRRGYRFIAPVASPATPPSSPVETATPPPPEPRAPRAVPVVAAWTAGLSVLLAGLVLSSHGDPSRERGPAPEIRSLAVLPFQNLTGDAEQDYFVDGVTDALTTDLAQIHALKVISRTSAMQYGRRDKSLPRIARELGVDAVVEGAVTRSGDRVRVTAQLIHAATDRHLWARSYDRELRDVLALQGEVATAIAQAVQAEVRPDERRRLSRMTTVRAEAYESYLKGRHYWAMRGRENMAAAAGYFRQSIAEDPTYAPAFSGLSDTYRQSETLGLAAPRAYMPKAEAAARKALALDESLAEAHASLAGVLYRYRWDWKGADEAFRRSLDLDPNSAEAHRAYAIYLLTMRRNSDALAEARRAAELSPLSSIIAVEAAMAAARAGRDDLAREYLRKARELEPGFARADLTMALLHAQRGDLPQAVAVFDERRGGKPVGAAAGPWMGFVYGAAGRTADARAVLRAVEARAREQYVTPQSLAVVHLGLGDRDRAFGLLERAFDERAIDGLGLSGPLYDELHDDPRYRNLIGRMGLENAYFPG